MGNKATHAGLELLQADITGLAVDAIVNAANGSLLGGGGVDGAIHRAAGPQLLAACRRVRADELGGSQLATGQAVITPGFDLPARYVIHVVGPVWREEAADEMRELLASCYRNAFALAAKHGLRSIAFPSVSTGVYGYPIERAARVALGEITLALRKGQVDKVTVALFSPADLEVYRRTLQELDGEG